MPRLLFKTQVKQNLHMWLNNLFLKEGYFDTVNAGETDIYSRDISLLQSTSDESFADGQVWQSPFKQWVHESGIVPIYSGVAPPLVASGVTVDGTFYSKYPSDPNYNASYAHWVDYPNGRIIFQSPISTNSTVQAEFSYKEIDVDFEDSFENESGDFLIETSYKDNPHQSGLEIYPSRDTKTLPLVIIDVTSTDREAYELGSASNVAVLQGSLIIWSRNNFQRDQIEELLSSQESVVLQGINFNTAPQPLNFYGDKNLEFTSYDEFADAWGVYGWKRIYIDEIFTRKLNKLLNIQRSQASFTIRVYPNF